MSEDVLVKEVVDEVPIPGALGRVRHASISLRSVLAAGTFVLYGTAAAPFYADHGGSMLALGVMPVTIAGWLLGMWGGLVAGLALVPLHGLLGEMAGIEGAGIAGEGMAPWIGVLVLVGTGVGGVRDLTDRWERALGARSRAEAELREIGVQLEERVQRRTADLRAANESLQREIGQRREVVAALRESEHRFRQLAENTSEVFWLIDARERRVIYVSPAFEKVWGRGSDLLYDAPEKLAETIHPEDRAELGMGIVRDFSGHEEQEYRITRPDGGVRWVRTRTFPVRDESGRTVRLVGLSEDVTERKESERRLREVALRDPVTGLANRISFMNRLARSVSRMRFRPDALFAVLFIDVDNFKEINDRLGHVAGDELLASIARRLENCVRPEDLVARMGGDEFTVLLHDIAGPADAARVATRILETLAEPVRLGRQEAIVTASIGIASSEGHRRPEDLLRDADAAMYRAKTTRTGRYVMFDADMHAAAVARLQLETDLITAVEEDQFYLEYQPVIALGTGKIAGFEALTRWRHPVQGLVPPDIFVGVAEATGQIVELGRWVLGSATGQLNRWTRDLRRSDLTLSVNLSGRQVVNAGMIDDLRRLLDRVDIDPSRIKLEITEAILVDRGLAAEVFLQKVKEFGCQIQLDDFGIGYASVNHLDRFPIDTVKIDGSIVSRLEGDGVNQQLVATVIELGHNLGMDVVAEAVETQGQLDRLRRLGCEFAQGYLFSRPLPPEGITSLLREDPTW
jgi:diguanylate cyclase (GGDEF)-like protein/PAS domain S-box-containing protein